MKKSKLKQKKFKSLGLNLGVFNFVNWHAYQEKFKEKCMQI